MRKVLPFLLTTTVLLLVINNARAQEVSVTPKPTGKFGEEVKELRNQNQEERKTLMEENKKEREDLNAKNKASREEFRTDTKNLLISKTPEEEKRFALLLFKKGKIFYRKMRKAEKHSERLFGQRWIHFVNLYGQNGKMYGIPFSERSNVLSESRYGMIEHNGETRE